MDNGTHVSWSIANPTMLYTRGTTLWLGVAAQQPRGCSMAAAEATELLEGDDAQDLVDACVAIHCSCEGRGATPSEFCGFEQLAPA